MVERLKSYYTEMLVGPPHFGAARRRSLEFRRFPLDLPAFNAVEKKSLMLAPLLYRYPQDMGDIPETLRQHARDALFAVVSCRPPYSHDALFSIDAVREFLDAFAAYREKDATDLRSSLFGNLYALSQYAQDSHAIETLRGHVRRMGWEAEYDAFEKEQKERSIRRVHETMDRAFWDVFRESIQQHELSLLKRTLEEVHTLLRDIPHPRLSDRGAAYLEDLFSSTSWEHWTLSQVQNWFSRVLTYLQECDAPSMDAVYRQAMEDLIAGDTVADVVSKGMETLYAVLVPLRAKIAVVREALEA